MSPLTSRRAFLKASALTATAVGLPMVASSRVLGANDEILMGIVGCGIRGAGGFGHLPNFGKLQGVRIVAVADADRSRAEGAAKAIEKRFNYKADTYQDMRRLFEREDIQAVSIATMQYWHGLATIWACQAGKQVYCEKPLSHFIWEGRQMVSAARKYDRLVQIGTQYRSIKAYETLAQWLKEGHLGKLRYATCVANKSRRSIGKRDQPLPIPDYIDYDLWCGPARKEPVYRDKLQYDGSFTWNMGDGESCNQGVHEVDIARWVLGYDTLPRRAMSIGGRFVVDDVGEVPNTQIICYDYPDVPILYEVHNLPKSRECLTPEKWNQMPGFQGMFMPWGVHIQCEGGYTVGTTAYDTAGKVMQQFTGEEDHFANFIGAVRSGRREDLNAEIAGGHISTSICHVGNISYRLGRPASVAEQREQLGDVAGWREMHDRYVTYLEGLGVAPETSILGPWIDVDAEKECITGAHHEEGNKLVRGCYREPYTMPEVTRA